jgi:zinc transport system permease protein
MRIIMTTIMKATAMTTSFIYALLAGVGVALVSGPIGCFVVWRRMAYFGETLAHAGLLGVGLGIIYGFNLVLGALLSAVVMVIVLLALRNKAKLGFDTALGVLAHSSLALGLLTLGVAAKAADDHHEILFGDVNVLTANSVLAIWLGGAAVLGLLVYLWRDLIAISVHEDLARAEGVHVERTEFLFMVAMAAMTAFAMQVVGLLLITALTIIPAAAARRLAHSPEVMALWAAGFAVLATLVGLTFWQHFGLDAGPAVVLATTFIFILTLAIPQRR